MFMGQLIFSLTDICYYRRGRGGRKGKAIGNPGQTEHNNSKNNQLYTCFFFLSVFIYKIKQQTTVLGGFLFLKKGLTYQQNEILPRLKRFVHNINDTAVGRSLSRVRLKSQFFSTVYCSYRMV